MAKAGADYIQVSGHVGGTGRSPLSSIKHVGIPWELGLAEVHQVLMRNGLRDRVALRTDGGLQTGRDVVIAALLGAEEYGFGTAALVALGCDMARQCHLDTCPTGIATQREDLRAKFTGTPEDVVRFFTAIAEDVRRELSRLGAPSLGEVVGEAARLRPDATRTLDLDRLLRLPRGRRRRATLGPRPRTLEVERRRRRGGPARGRVRRRGPRSRRGLEHPVGLGHGPRASRDITTAERSFGAHTTGAHRARPRPPAVRWRLAGSAGQSFGAFANPRVGWSWSARRTTTSARVSRAGRSSSVRRTRSRAAVDLAIAGNACLYGATGGRLHLVGRAGIRFAVRNSGAEAVVEGVGAHGCEYMTGGRGRHRARRREPRRGHDRWPGLPLGPDGTRITGSDGNSGADTAARRSSAPARTARRRSPSCTSCSRPIGMPARRGRASSWPRRVS